jgi:uncharacterized protein
VEALLHRRYDKSTAARGPCRSSEVVELVDVPEPTGRPASKMIVERSTNVGFADRCKLNCSGDRHVRLNFKKTAVATGASSGIGAVYADRVAARGYDLILVARRADRLAAVSEKLSAAFGTKVEVIAADLEKEADLIRVEKVLATNPAVRILVNNAGLARLLPVGQSRVEDSMSQIAPNIAALTRLTHGVLRALLARNDGAIVNIASVLALHALPVSAAATATELRDASGVPLSTLDQRTVMTVENMVDAAFSGFDRGEAVTLPSLADASPLGQV